MPDGGGADRRALCRVEVVGHLQRDWPDWFDGMMITDLPDGNTLLVGLIADQAALRGLIDKVYALGLSLVSVNYDITKTNSPEHRFSSPVHGKEDEGTWQAR